VSGTVSGHSFDISASCVAFENAFPPLVGTVSYKTSSGSAGVTKLSFNGGTLNYMAMPLTITYPKKGGSGSAKGSFALKSPKMTLVLSQTYPQWVGSCQSAAGLSTMTLASGSSITA